MSKSYKGILIRRRVITVTAVFFLFVMIIVALFGKNAHASSNHIKCDKYYKPYTVCQQDTLSSLALKFAGISDVNLDDYIEEVRYINGIYDYTIYEGQILFVPYYLPSSSL